MGVPSLSSDGPAETLNFGSASNSTIPIRTQPTVTGRGTFVIPEPGAWELFVEVWPVGQPCPHPSVYEPLTGQRLAWRLRNVTTGEVIYPAVPPVVTLHTED